jgi:bifunctional non-homologous end joining protein LigD
MRDFLATPEPGGVGGSPRPDSPLVAVGVVLTSTYATSLHWDRRLERDGVLASWAVPKGIPPHTRTNHLAVRTPRITRIARFSVALNTSGRAGSLSVSQPVSQDHPSSPTAATPANVSNAMKVGMKPTR